MIAPPTRSPYVERQPDSDESTGLARPNDTDALGSAPARPAPTDHLVPDQPIHLLDSTGEFSCPHCSGTIRLQGIGLRFEGGDNTNTVRLDLRHPEDPLDDIVDDVRRVLAIRALREANGVKVKAAEIAGMKYTTFYELVRRLGITEDDYRS